MTIRCPRCHTNTFRSWEELEEHQSAQVPCEWRPSKPEDRTINRGQYEKLKKKSREKKTEEEKWKGIYRIIDPDAEEVPSPFCTSSVSSTGSSIDKIHECWQQESNKMFEQILQEVAVDGDLKAALRGKMALLPEIVMGRCRHQTRSAVGSPSSASEPPTPLSPLQTSGTPHEDGKEASDAETNDGGPPRKKQRTVAPVSEEESLWTRQATMVPQDIQSPLVPPGIALKESTNTTCFSSPNLGTSVFSQPFGPFIASEASFQPAQPSIAIPYNNNNILLGMPDPAQTLNWEANLALCESEVAEPSAPPKDNEPGASNHVSDSGFNITSAEIEEFNWMLDNWPGEYNFGIDP